MANVKTWIIAARLRTLPLAIASFLVGTSLAYRAGSLDYAIAGLTILTALFLQVLSNFANDYGDAVSGVDSDERSGPDRMVQSGEITKESMRKALVVLSIITFLSGLGLLAAAFPEDLLTAGIFLLLGISAIVSAIKYTVGKNPYGYAGFGDLFVFIFFGVVAVSGTFFLQTKSLDPWVLLPAATLGLFAVGVLNVNNIRDIESDKISGKNSIPVRIGKKKAVAYHKVLLLVGWIMSLVYVGFTFQSYIEFAFVIVLILLVKNINAVASKPADKLDPYLKQMAITTLLYGLLFSLGQFFS